MDYATAVCSVQSVIMSITGLQLLTSAYDDYDGPCNLDDEDNPNTIDESGSPGGVTTMKINNKIPTHKVDSATHDSKRLKCDSQRSALPLPNEIATMFKESYEEESDDPYLHEGRVRSFPHKRGNWSSYVYIPFSCLDQGGIEQLHSKIMKSFCNPNCGIRPILEPHLSLSKTIVLRHHWINAFMASLQSKFSCESGVDLVLDTVEIYVNEEKTRTFIGMKVLPTQPLLNLVNCCDSCLAEYNLEPYYKDPSFHISLAWLIGDQSKSENLLKYKESLCSYWEELCESDSMLRSIEVETVELKTGFKVYRFSLSTSW